jgi:hypothetical protein
MFICLYAHVFVYWFIQSEHRSHRCAKRRLNLEVADSESSSEEHGEELTGIHAPGCESWTKRESEKVGLEARLQFRGYGINRIMPPMFE